MNARYPLLLLLAALVGSSIPAALAQNSISAEQRADILELMTLTQAADTGATLSAALSRQIVTSLSGTRHGVSPHTLRVVRDVVDAYLKHGFADELIHAMVPVYAKHFTPQDIKGLLAFYRTPLGQKTIAVQPALLSEGMQAGQAGAKRALPALTADVQQRLLNAAKPLSD